MDKNIVSLVKCDEYNFDQVKNALLENIEALGGLEKYIDKGEKVLIKVNLLMKKKPEEATTTHPTYVKALAKILVDYGCEVIVGDSPGGPFNKNILKSMYKYTGLEEVLEVGAKLNFNCESFTKKNPDGLLLKSLVMTDMLNDCTKVISCSKLKTHCMMTLTGAVKNMFGTVPGIKKAEYHLNMKTHDDFAQCLIDICLAANPILSFMDGIVAMEGDGPSAGKPRKIGVSIASASPFHLDKVACGIIDLDLDKVATVRCAVARGLCEDGLDDINIVGCKIDDFKAVDFIIPKTRMIGLASNLPKPVERFLNKTIQPQPTFDYAKCVKCGICAESCPAKVISMETGAPIVSLENCIRCFCCQELCPKKAVDVKRPWLLKLLVK